MAYGLASLFISPGYFRVVKTHTDETTGKRRVVEGGTTLGTIMHTKEGVVLAITGGETTTHDCQDAAMAEAVYRLID